MMRSFFCALVALLFLSAPLCAQDAAALRQQITAAGKGTTVVLPAGAFALGNLTLPDGVSLRGAGHDRTIIDATGCDFGITVSGKLPVRISDLTIRNATQIGLLLDGAQGGTVEGVAVLKCGSGCIVREAAECALSNLILGGNGGGVSLVRCTRVSLVNATVTHTTGTALRVNDCVKTTIFNNLFTYAAYGVNVSGSNRELSIDHNLYIANFVGQLQGEAMRKKVEAWASLSGYDRHSLTLGVTYKDPAADDYRPISPLPWAPIRATSSDWGVKALAGANAPATDIDGHPRAGGIDLGAYEISFPAPRPADGSFTVQSGAAVTSAGLFTNDDRCVRYLFQNMPLAKGKYDYWLPSRDWQGKIIPAGDYTIKLTEADLRLDYVAAAGNGDVQMSTKELGDGVSKRASLDPQMGVFDAVGQLIIAQSGFESGQHVRGYDKEMTRFRWSFPGGGETRGIAVDDKGRVLVLRKPGSLIRLDSATGKPVMFASGSIEHSYKDRLQEVNGMAWLGDHLYIADQKAGKLLALIGDELTVDGDFPLPGVMQPAGDTRTMLVWVISNGELAALDQHGTVKFHAKPMENPTLLAACNGRLAVYSEKTRKVSIYDSSDPANLKPLRSIGTGDDGYGKIIADRLWEPRALALSTSGELAVIDNAHTLLFAADGTAKRLHMGMWGQAISYGWFANDDHIHFFNIGGNWDILLDAKHHSWEPGTRWRYTMPFDGPIFFFTTGGKNFGIFQQRVKDSGDFMAIVRMEDDGTGRLLARYGCNAGGLYLQRDTDGDGVIAATDPIEPVLGADGKRITESIVAGAFFNTDTQRDGSLAIPVGPGVLTVPMTGLDEKGVPHYDFTRKRLIVGTVSDGKPNYSSPYDFITAENIDIANDLYYQPGKGYFAAIRTKSGPGPDPATEHSNGTSLAGFDADGKLRWFSPMNPFGLKLGFHGITSVGGINIAGRGSLCEFETMDDDGLGTGVLGVPSAMGWMGMWLDNHRQVQSFTGNDGKPYLIVGDYAAQAYHWMALTGADKLRHQSLKITVTSELADRLKAEAPVVVPIWPVPAPPRITVKKLPVPLPTDCDLAKWRTLGVSPLVISAADPAANSAVVRMGYTNEAIYVQIIKFDNIITLHQTDPGRHYQQDGVEFNIDTFWSGWKYNVTRMAGVDIVLRDRFFGESRLLTPDEMPRAIKILGSAADVPERKLLEASTGVDMSKCKVMIIEFKLGKAALAALPKDNLKELLSGKTFELGITINHNSLPGSDLFDPIGWPVGYGAFSRDNDLATAVLE